MNCSKILLGILLSAGLISLTAHADINTSGIHVKWTYIGNTGPERWGQLDPAFALCSRGKSQSPIDIPKKVKKIPGTLSVQYQTSNALDIGNDVTTDLMLGKTRTIIDDGHGLQVNFQHDTSREIMSFAGKTYHLLQFHIHTPSETEWHNRSFPMEIHFVNQSDDGSVAVIAVFVNGGEKNPVLDTLIANMPTEKGKETIVKGDKINPGSLIPAKSGYFSFTGSLTTPPCTEGLQWIVMAEPITASPPQILQIRKANGGVNARPVQPLYKRTVYYSEG